MPIHSVSAFADDVGLVTRKLHQCLAIIGALAEILHSATAMRLNPQKSVIVPLGRQTAITIQRYVNECIPSIGGIGVATHGMYLGFAFGPDAEDARWQNAGTKFWHRGMAARGAGGGFFH